MFQSNPYFDTTIKVDEAAPLVANVTIEPIDGLSIEPNAFNHKAKANHDDLEDLFSRIPNPEKIKVFEVSYNANLTTLPNIERFYNLEYLYIAGRQIKDITVVEKFPKLKSLFIVNHKKNQLHVNDNCKLENFRAIRGRLETITFGADYFELQSCSKLTNFEKIEATNVQLEDCHSLDLNTLENVSGLEKIEILGRKNLASLNFLLGCSSVKNLVVTATDVRKTDTRALDKSKTLERCFLGQCNKKLLIEIASQAPRLILTNGDFAYRGEEVLKVSDYYDEV